MNGTLYQFKPVNLFSSAPKVRHVGYQSWTEDNLLVESDHNDILYYTTRWDALCPYINVSEEMINFAPRPFVVYALPPDSPYGVPINDKYIINVLQAHSYECGIVGAFNADQGGQWFVYNPNIPEGKAGAVTSESLLS